MSSPADLPDDWWTVENVAAYLAVSTGTVRTYAARSEMPAPERKIGHANLWKPQTIISWHESRPRPRKRPTSE